MAELGEFFRTLPTMFGELWVFIEGFYGLAVLAVSIIATAALLFGAVTLRATHGWLSAIFGGMATVIGFYWFFGIIPSAWVYFADGSRDLLEGTIIPSRLPGLDNFYEVFRDLVVLAETGIALAGTVVLALWVQKRYPRGLAEGEVQGPTSGGYR